MIEAPPETSGEAGPEREPLTEALRHEARDDIAGRVGRVRPRHLILAAALGLMLAPSACGDPVAPEVGTTYGLASVSGRRVPTWRSIVPPTDSVFLAVIYEEYKVLSDSTIAHNLWAGFGHRQADSTITYVTAGCWINYPIQYRSHEDTLWLTPDPGVPSPPPTPAFLLARGPDLRVSVEASSDGLTYRFVPSRPVAARC